jgi:hypothetical protein
MFKFRFVITTLSTSIKMMNNLKVPALISRETVYMALDAWGHVCWFLLSLECGYMSTKVHRQGDTLP